MQKTENFKVDLVQIARQAMFSRGLSPDFPPDAISQLDKIIAPASCQEVGEIRDMSDKLWFSIDNDDSLDLDQLTYAEQIDPQTVRIYVAIADVDAIVKKDTPIDLHALANTTSVYTPMIIFPMLPEKLSTDFTSLNPDEKRIAMVVQMDVDESGKVNQSQIYQSCVYNYAKLAYNSVGAWLENEAPPPPAVQKVKDLDSQIRLQNEVAQRMKNYRFKSGALTFETYDPQPVIKDGKIVDLQEVKINKARELIENFMIAANGSITLFLEKSGHPTIKRIVRTPKRWDRIVEFAAEYKFKLPPEPDSKALENFLLQRREADPLRFPDLSLMVIKLMGRGEYIVQGPEEEPLGHFALALSNYTHATAPNRRYPDLVVQRMLKATLINQPAPYSLQKLQEMMRACTQKETSAEKVKRSVMKSVIALYLQNSIGKTFDAFVTGNNENGTWIRLISTAIEGKLVEGYQNVDVGDKLRVKLIAVNVEKGFLDFVRI
jgi:VacB/RNase II family 3'-5' exoribonuclease